MAETKYFTSNELLGRRVERSHSTKCNEVDHSHSTESDLISHFRMILKTALKSNNYSIRTSSPQYPTEVEQ
jgi:hypothetical protein